MSEMKDGGDLVQLIQEADLALMQMEQARGAVEAAKLAFEMSKEDFDRSREAFDQVISKADDYDIPRSKLKKLAEERSAALLASGLLSSPANLARPAKPKVSRKPKEPKATAMNDLPVDAVSDAVLN